MTKRLHVVGAGVVLLIFAVLFINPVVNAQCKHFAYNPFMNGGKGGMDCVVAGGANGVLGDVTLASGIFSRAGTLGLSATGANVVTFSTNGSERGRWSSGGNYLIGTTTDGGSSKLQVAGLSTNYGMTVYNPIAVTGATSLVVKAGEGQSFTALQTWQNNANATLSAIGYDGGYWLGDGTARFSLTFAIQAMGANFALAWKDNAAVFSGSYDIGLKRASAGVLEVNNGSAGTYRDLLSRSLIGTATAAATLANSQFTFHLASDTSLVVTAKGSDGTLRSVALTLAP